MVLHRRGVVAAVGGYLAVGGDQGDASLGRTVQASHEALQGGRWRPRRRGQGALREAGVGQQPGLHHRHALAAHGDLQAKVKQQEDHRGERREGKGDFPAKGDSHGASANL